jgi:hypothetical protein
MSGNSYFECSKEAHKNLGMLSEGPYTGIAGLPEDSESLRM